MPPPGPSACVAMAYAPRDADASPAETVLSLQPVVTDPVEVLPPEIFAQILESLDSWTLLVAIPGVSHRWHASLAHLHAVELDLSFLGPTALIRRLHTSESAKVLTKVLQLGVFGQVTSLNLGGFINMPDAVITAVVGRCPLLKSLSLEGCERLTYVGIAAVCDCHGLVSLDLRGCCLTLSSIAHYFKAWPNLEEFHYKQTTELSEFHDGLPCLDEVVNIVAGYCPNLQAVSLIDCASLTDAGVHSLVRQCSQLSALDVSGCSQITRASVTEFIQAASHQLTLFKCVGCSDFLPVVELLATSCPNLEDVSVPLCAVGRTEFPALASRCPKLRGIHVENAENVRTADLALLADSCPELERIELHSLWSVESDRTDDGLARVARRCRRLQVFHCLDATNGVVSSLAINCRDLSTLELSDSFVTDTGARSIGHRCKNLTTLVISNDGMPSKVTSKGIAAIAEGCPRLSSVTLQNCPGVSSPGISALSRHCTRLHTLIVRKSGKVTNACVATLAKQCPLYTLCIGRTPESTVSAATVLAVAKHCPGLVDLSFRGAILTDECLVRLAEDCPLLRFVDFRETWGYSLAAKEQFEKDCVFLRAAHFPTPKEIRCQWFSWNT